MDKHLVTFDGMAKRVFGPSAQIDGSLGSAMGPGELRIAVDDRLLGDGETFAEALQAAQRRAATLATSTGACGEGTCAHKVLHYVRPRCTGEIPQSGDRVAPDAGPGRRRI
jgi:hypothetical protein